MTKIEWTNETWNPVTGCTKVSAGCRNCYAETQAPRCFAGQTVVEHAFVDHPNTVEVRERSRPRRFADVRCHPERLKKPLGWRKPRKVFVNSMSDLFHEEVPDWFIARVFGIMAAAEHHTFQVLTKRPERMRQLLTSDEFQDEMCHESRRLTGDPRMGAHFWPLRNVSLGVSAETQETYDERIDLLVKTPAAVRFVSAEPLLAPIDVMLTTCGGEPIWRHWIDWIIVGGESGHGARPCHVDWIRSIIQQCAEAEVACFVKQLGANVRDRNDVGFDGSPGAAWDLDPIQDVVHVGTAPYQGADVRVFLRARKGGDPSEWPQDLRVREFPRGVQA